MKEQSLDLAVIGNSTIAALIDRSGRIVWWCFPRLDGDPIFCRLLAGSEEKGFADVELQNQTGQQSRYLRNSAIMETILTDSHGASLRITDFCPRFKQHGRLYRPPMIMRRIEPVKGLPLIRIRIRPTANYGAELLRPTNGSNHLRYRNEDSAIRVTTDAPSSYIAEETLFTLTQPIHLIIGPDEYFDSAIVPTFHHFMEQTLDYWQEWVRYLAIPFEWQQPVIRAAITLKLCAYEETGGIVAALTTSIPEAPGSQRNWDYRFCWLRDSYFTVQALNRLGATKTMEDFLHYITNIIATNEGSDIKPLHRLVPGLPLEERTIEALAGYRNMGPVRAGNGAWNQIQNDGYGSIILSVAQMFFDERLPFMGDDALFERLEQLGKRALEVALEPDAGLWEFRGRAQIHTHSAALCWAAIDRLGRIASRLGHQERAAYWSEHAIQLRQTILERAWNDKRKSFVSAFEGNALDASLLQLPELGLISYQDPRFLKTLEHIEKELSFGGHLKRYAEADDFGVPDVAFTICRFWYIEALTAVGRKTEARDHFIDMLAHRNHFGLLSEDIHPQNGELWGNIPQTYSMVGLILSALRLSKGWEDELWRPFAH